MENNIEKRDNGRMSQKTEGLAKEQCESSEGGVISNRKLRSRALTGIAFAGAMFASGCKVGKSFGPSEIGPTIDGMASEDEFNHEVSLAPCLLDFDGSGAYIPEQDGLFPHSYTGLGLQPGHLSDCVHDCRQTNDTATDVAARMDDLTGM